MTWSVILPALNEAERLSASLASVARELPGAEVIVTDGGSADATVEMARARGATVVDHARGRGAQCCAGVAVASGAWFLFLHADTTLPEGAGHLLATHARRRPDSVATFRLSFDQPHWFLRASAWFSRFDTMFTRFGDQGIAVRSQVWHALGGMPHWPLFEDVAFLEAARRAGGLVSLPAAVITSARRFGEQPFRRQWENLRLLLRYRRGACPFALAREYDARKQRESNARAGRQTISLADG